MQIHPVYQIFVDSEKVFGQATFQIENAALLRKRISEIKAPIDPSVSFRIVHVVIVWVIELRL